MNRGIVIISIVFAVLGSVSPAAAQFTISRVKPSTIDTRGIRDSIKGTTLTNTYYSKAFAEAERKRIRKERNTLEFTSTLDISQTAFDNWAAGGDNTFAGGATLFFRHQHKRSIFSYEDKFEAKYGMQLIDKKAFKNVDFFNAFGQVAWKMNKSWAYTGTINLRSQFTVGYKSRTDSTKVSNFMSPGYLDITIGFSYHKEGSPLTINISPASGNITIVTDPELTERYKLDPGTKTKGRLGPSVRVNFDKEFAKKIFRYRSMFYSFSNLKLTPIAQWENTFEIRPLKFFSTTFSWRLYYDRDTPTPMPKKLQSYYSLTIGLRYQYKNK